MIGLLVCIMREITLKNKKVLLFLIGVCIGVVIIGSFFTGAIISCSNGGGTLKDITCVNPKVVGVCVQDGVMYLPANDTTLQVNLIV